MKAHELAAELRSAYESERDEIAKTRYYANDGLAHGYFSRDVAPVWGSVLNVDADDVIKTCGLSKSALRLIHFFGRAIHKKATGRSRAMVVTAFPPEHSGDTVRTHMAYPKSGLAKVCGISKATVDAAIHVLGGRRGRDGMLVENGLCCPQFVGSGVIIDGLFTMQIGFPFMYELSTYQESTILALRNRVGMGQTAMKIVNWNRGAKEAHEKSKPGLTKPLAPVVDLRPVAEASDVEHPAAEE